MPPVPMWPVRMISFAPSTVCGKIVLITSAFATFAVAAAAPAAPAALMKPRRLGFLLS